MTLEILGFPRSNFVRTVRMGAHEKDVAYELVPEPPHSDAVKAIHPFGLIPALRHDGFECCEAIAILRYIDAVFDGPVLFPSQPRAAARVDQWCSIVATSVDQLLLRNYVVEYLFNKDDDGNVVRTKIDPAVKRFPRMFRKLNEAVAHGYVGHDEFTVADCFLAPIVAVVQLFPEGKEAFEASPQLVDYFSRIRERPSFIATAPQ